MSCLESWALKEFNRVSGNSTRKRTSTEQKMAFLNGRVSPEPLCPSTTEGGTELSDSLPLGEKGTNHFNHSEDTKTPIIDYRGPKECQEELDSILEEELHNEPSGPFQNGKISPRRQSREGNISSGRYHACDRLVLLAVCFMSTASLLVTLLMLFGMVAPRNCACSGETGICNCFLWITLFPIRKLQIKFIPRNFRNSFSRVAIN